MKNKFIPVPRCKNPECNKPINCPKKNKSGYCSNCKQMRPEIKVWRREYDQRPEVKAKHREYQRKFNAKKKLKEKK